MSATARRGRPVDREAGDELGHEVLRVGGRASVAADEQLFTGGHGFGSQLADGMHGGVESFVVVDELHHGDGLGKLLADEVFHKVLRVEGSRAT